MAVAVISSSSSLSLLTLSFLISIGRLPSSHVVTPRYDRNDGLKLQGASHPGTRDKGMLSDLCGGARWLIKTSDPVVMMRVLEQQSGFEGRESEICALVQEVVGTGHD